MALGNVLGTSRPRTALVVRHIAFEDMGTFEDVLITRGYTVRTVDAGVDDAFGALVDVDLALIGGGPIGAYETDRYPFLKEELRALEQRLSAGRPTLGICLGSQLLAAALGARVYPGPEREVGWGAVALTEPGRASSLAELEGQRVLHWHGDTFELPRGAVRLASTAAYANQAFSIGANVLALQFHPEIDGRRFERWLIAYGAELAALKLDLATLRAEAKAEADALRAAGIKMFGRWLDGLSP